MRTRLFYPHFLIVTRPIARFTFQGEIVVRVSVDEEAAGSSSSTSGDDSRSRSRRTIHIAISDTGIGIPTDKLDRLFRSFSQVEASHARRFGGSGLGLAISQRLAEAMGGKMWVKSTENVGSTFHFTIEVFESEIVPFGKKEKPTLSGKRVLIVEDVQSRAQILDELLANSGAETTVVPCSAIPQRSASEWDIFVIDGDSVVAPEAISELDCPRLILYKFGKSTSNLSDASDADVARVSKPVKQSRLENAILALLEASHSHSRSSKAEPSLSEKVKSLSIFGPIKWDGAHDDPLVERPPSETLSVDQSSSDALSINQFPSPTLSAGRNPSDALSDRSHSTVGTLINAEFRGTSTDWGADPRLRILVVEDNQINQLLVRKLLSRAGFVAEIANNGLEAIEAISDKNKIFDCVLMDVQMPLCDGFEATRWIRANVPAERQPSIIAVTANALLNEREACLQAGMDNYISKPIDAKQLAAAVRACRRLPIEVEGLGNTFCKSELTDA